VTSNRPYLLRALYEWIVDNNYTPHMLVDAKAEGVQVPVDYVEDGRIVLNAAPGAVRDLMMGNDEVSFGARFGGKPMTVILPIGAVLGIYARENGQGMLFPEEDSSETRPEPPEPPKPSSKRPGLKVVK